jgi:hypothetical protein
MKRQIFIGHGLNTDETRVFVPKERRKLASYEVAGTARQTIVS